METVNQLEKAVAQVGNITIHYNKAVDSRNSSVVPTHQPLPYEVAKKAGFGLRGETGFVHVLLFSKTDVATGATKWSGSVKIVDAKGAELGSLFLSRNLVKKLYDEHTDEVGQWQNVVKQHDSGNATVKVDSKSIRFYGLKNTVTEEQWTVIGTVSTGGAGIA